MWKIDVLRCQGFVCMFTEYVVLDWCGKCKNKLIEDLGGLTKLLGGPSISFSCVELFLICENMTC